MYQITNLLDGKIYIGVHKTSNIDDGYMGSGLHLKRAQEKYGLVNFKKEILKFFETREEMFREEAEIITSEFVKREDTYNIALGGKTPGFEAESRGGMITGSRSYKEKTGMFTPEAIENRQKWTKSKTNQDRMRAIHLLGSAAALTDESRKKRKETYKTIKHSQGEKNSQYGKMWIHKGLENKKIDKTSPVPEGWEKGRKLK